MMTRIALLAALSLILPARPPVFQGGCPPACTCLCADQGGVLTGNFDPACMSLLDFSVCSGPTPDGCCKNLMTSCAEATQAPCHVVIDIKACWINNCAQQGRVQIMVTVGGTQVGRASGICAHLYNDTAPNCGQSVIATVTWTDNTGQPVATYVRTFLCQTGTNC